MIVPDTAITFDDIAAPLGGDASAWWLDEQGGLHLIPDLPAAAMDDLARITRDAPAHGRYERRRLLGSIFARDDWTLHRALDRLARVLPGYRWMQFGSA